MAKPVSKSSTKFFPVEESSGIERFALWGLWGLIFFAPFFRGLFFAQEQRAALLVAVFVFLLTCFSSYKKGFPSFFKGPLDFLILGLPLIYMAAAFTAANYALALDEVIKNIIYFMVFYSAARLVRSEKQVENIFYVIFFGAVVVALAGLFTASGWIEIKDGYLAQEGGIIASTFQYKNALASFLVVSIFVGLYIWANNKNIYARPLLGAANFILATVLFSTQSQGGYIIFAAFSLLLWFLCPAQIRFNLITGTVILVGSGLVFSRLYLYYIMDKKLLTAWVCLLTGVVVVALAQWFITKLWGDKKLSITNRQLLAFASLLIFLVTIGVFLTGFYKIIIEKIHMFGAMERMTMYQDGFKMLFQRPLLGWGGGSWSEAYTMFQSYGYNVRQTHSYFLQLAIETGFAGLLLTAAIWSTVLFRGIRLLRETAENLRHRFILAVLLCSVLALLAHSVVDFNLSLSALSIILFVLTACLFADYRGGAVKSNDKKGKDRERKRRISPLAAATVASLILLTVAFSLLSSTKYAMSAMEAIKIGDGSKAAQMMEGAIKSNPLNADNYLLQASIMGSLGKNPQAVENADKALRMARYSSDRHVNASQIYARAGDNARAVAAARRAVELAPLKVTYYEQLSFMLTSVALSEIKNGKVEAAHNYTKQVLIIPEDINRIINGVDPDKKKLWVYAKPLEITDKIKLYLGVANLIEGNAGVAEQYINEVSANQSLPKETLLWQAMLALKKGDNNRVQEILLAADKDSPDIRRQFNQLVALKYF